MSDTHEWFFEISNPSDEPRTEHVEVDLEALGSPTPNPSGCYSLHKKQAYGGWEQVECQVDPLDDIGLKGVLSFRVDALPPSGVDDYSIASACFKLKEEDAPKKTPGNSSLYLDYYYKNAPGDGYSPVELDDDEAYGLKFRSKNLEFYLSLVPDPAEFWAPPQKPSGNIAGAVTSIVSGIGNLFLPGMQILTEDFPNGDYWGKITELSLPLSPWELKNPHIERIDQEYELVHSNCGPVRIVAVIRSQPIHFHYSRFPLGNASTVEKLPVSCRLYRVFSLYPDITGYAEEIFVLTEKKSGGLPISFCPHFLSSFSSYSNAQEVFGNNNTLHRLGYIPDYFLLHTFFGYQGPHENLSAVASDSCIRDIRICNNSISFQLSTGFRKRLRYLFPCNLKRDKLNLDEIGRHWYEALYKPISIVRPKKRSYSPIG